MKTLFFLKLLFTSIEIYFFPKIWKKVSKKKKRNKNNFQAALLIVNQF